MSYRIQSEWDLGYENLVFVSIPKAREWLTNDPNFSDVMVDCDLDSVEDAEKAGLISYIPLKKVR